MASLVDIFKAKETVIYNKLTTCQESKQPHLSCKRNPRTEKLTEPDQIRNGSGFGFDIKRTGLNRTGSLSIYFNFLYHL